MKLTDAKKILSGDIEVTKVWLDDWDGKCGVNYIKNNSLCSAELTHDDILFCLRQLALKVVREKEKGK